MVACQPLSPSPEVVLPLKEESLSPRATGRQCSRELKIVRLEETFAKLLVQPFYSKRGETESGYYQMSCLRHPNRCLCMSKSLLKCHQSYSL